MKDFVLHTSDGGSNCALCSKTIRKGHNFVMATVRLLINQGNPMINICLSCIGTMVDTTKKKVVRKR